MPLCQVFHCSPVAFMNYDRHTYEWYREKYKASSKTELEEFANANPDLMQMIVYMINEWEGNFSMVVLMAFYYTLLEAHERSHISYLIGMSYRMKYEKNHDNPLIQLGYNRLDEYVSEWRKLTKKIL